MKDENKDEKKAEEKRKKTKQIDGIITLDVPQNLHKKSSSPCTNQSF